MTHTLRAPVQLRRTGVDALRGAAILLMVLDHVVAVTPDPAHPVRMTVTRFSLPLFMACAAAVWKGRPSHRRLLMLGAAAVADHVLCGALGFAIPGIVGLFLGLQLVLWAAPTIARYPGVFMAVGLVQTYYLPVQQLVPGWNGYQPGLVLAWWCLGRLAFDEVEHLGERAPAWLGRIGRYPLSWYVGHLLVLVVVVEGGLL